MAERRMFAKTIIDSDSFLDMPLTTQALYFHLSMRADDEGFVNNPKKIVRMIGASEDDYKLLSAKAFIISFDTGVIVIKHWKINNYLRSDRSKETLYQDERSMLRVKDTGAYTLISDGDTVGMNSTYGIPSDNQVTGERYTQNSIDKNSIEKDSIDYMIISSKIDDIIGQFNSICLSLPKVTKITETRKKTIKARLNDYSVEDLIMVFEKAEASDFLSGRNKQWTSCSFDWLMKPSNLIKVLEGNYDNKGQKQGGSYIDAINNRYNVVDAWYEGRRSSD